MASRLDESWRQIHVVRRRREEGWGEHRQQQQSKVQQNVSYDQWKQINKGVILVIDRLISKQTKRDSSKGEKGQEDEKSRSSFF